MMAEVRPSRLYLVPQVVGSVPDGEDYPEIDHELFVRGEVKKANACGGVVGYPPRSTEESPLGIVKCTDDRQVHIYLALLIVCMQYGVAFTPKPFRYALAF